MFLLRESLSAESRASNAAARGSETGFAAARRVFRMPVLSRLVAVGFCMYLAMALFETIFPLWAGARFEWGPPEVGLMFTYLGFMVGLTQAVLVGRLVPRFGEGRLVMTGLASYAVGLLIMTQAPIWQAMMFGITFTSAGGALVITTMNSLVSKQAADTDRGLVLGVFQSGSWMGRSVGPPVSGLLFGGVGVNSPLYVAALIMLPCLAIVAAIRARVAREAGAGSS
jgi:predicted MFS family arabinose efflux permease